ncbi:MAG TPA: hypothetical protein VFT08_08850 [Pyrinomonadaceae bacterium]|nr:hypothetical protein [Pyrinomonadaceae bacterium]
MKISFEAERYLRYVPFRLPWTMCVQEKLPPGAAGALVNQTHLFADLFVLIDATEKEMYEAIDGRRSIGEIVATVEGSAPRARDFSKNYGGTTKWCLIRLERTTQRSLLNNDENVKLYAISVDPPDASRDLADKIASDGKGKINFPLLRRSGPQNHRCIRPSRSRI